MKLLYVSAFGLLKVTTSAAIASLLILMGPAGHFNPLLAQLQLTGDAQQFPVLVGERNYTRFTADPVARTLSVAFIGEDGAVLAQDVVTI